MQRWNFKKREYEEHSVPEDWNVACLAEDMDDVLNCASCGEPVTFGETYSSRTIHTDMGFGYCVCTSCYEKEWEEEKKAKEND